MIPAASPGFSHHVCTLRKYCIQPSRPLGSTIANKSTFPMLGRRFLGKRFLGKEVRVHEIRGTWKSDIAAALFNSHDAYCLESNPGASESNAMPTPRVIHSHAGVV